MTDEDIVDRILSHEGGFIDHPADKGGATKYGITRATLAKWRGRTVTTEDVRELTVEEARAIYRSWYVLPWAWVTDAKLKALLVDWGVTSRRSAVIRALQMAVSATVDGIVGPETKRKTQEYIDAGKALTVQRTVLKLRMEYYMSLALEEPMLQALMRAGPPLQLLFLRGWLRRSLEFLTVLLCLSGTAYAQAHPCDVTPVSVDTKVPFAAGVCWNGLDTDGNPSSPLVALRVLVDGVVVATVADPVPDGPASATGEVFYRVPGLTVPKGARVLTFVVVNAEGESVPSDAYTFRVIGAPPSKPGKPRVEAR